MAGDRVEPRCAFFAIDGSVPRTASAGKRRSAIAENRKAEAAKEVKPLKEGRREPPASGLRDYRGAQPWRAKALRINSPASRMWYASASLVAQLR